MAKARLVYGREDVLNRFVKRHVETFAAPPLQIRAAHSVQVRVEPRSIR